MSQDNERLVTEDQFINTRKISQRVMKKKYVTAIDIGTTKIVALAGVREDGKIKILGTGSVPTPQNSVKRGVVLNIDDASQAIREAVDKAEAASGVKFKSAFVGIAGQHIKSRQSNHSLSITSNEYEITQADVDKLREEMYNMSLEPGEAIIHVIPQNYSVDKETGVTKPVGMFGKRLEGNFHIVIGEINSAKNIERCVERLEIKVNDLYLEPLASAAAVLTDEEKEAGVALVDIGGGTTDIAVYYDGILRYTAVIPYGGNVVTQDIKTGCSILHKHAELLKIKHGSAAVEAVKSDMVAVIPGIAGRAPKRIELAELSKIINGRMNEIIQMIDYMLINSGFRNKLGAGISLTGGGALLHFLPQLMKVKTGLDVKLAYPNKELIKDAPEMNKPQYSTAVGLLKLGFEDLDAVKAESDTFENIKAKEREDEEIRRQKELEEKERVEAEQRQKAEEELKRKQEEQVKKVEEEEARERRSGSWFNKIKDQLTIFQNDDEDEEQTKL